MRVTSAREQAKASPKNVLDSADLAGEFASEIERLSGAGLAGCLQCQKCTAGCPVAGRADVRAHELVRLAQLGQREKILESRMIWECTSCQTCRTRCPQGVDIAAMNDILRKLSREAASVHRATTLPVFNQAFLGSVRRRGRVYEVGLMATYKLRTFRLLEDMEQLPTMLYKRKLRLLPKNVRGKAERKQLFARAAEGTLERWGADAAARGQTATSSTRGNSPPRVKRQTPKERGTSTRPSPGGKRS